MPVSTLRAFAVIESSGNPKVSTGSYHGVYQLSHSEFRKYGGRGNIFDVEENTDVAARKLRSESDAFARQYGREPTANELYMIHQQGVEGAAKHMANPDAPAWRNMHPDRRGPAKRAGMGASGDLGERADRPAGAVPRRRQQHHQPPIHGAVGAEDDEVRRR